MNFNINDKIGFGDRYVIISCSLYLFDRDSYALGGNDIAGGIEDKICDCVG